MFTKLKTNLAGNLELTLCCMNRILKEQFFHTMMNGCKNGNSAGYSDYGRTVVYTWKQAGLMLSNVIKWADWREKKISIVLERSKSGGARNQQSGYTSRTD